VRLRYVECSAGRTNDERHRQAAYDLDHDQRPQSIPGSSAGAGVEAWARSVTPQSPADFAQAAANVVNKTEERESVEREKM
jgi:hypothetical protein